MTKLMPNDYKIAIHPSRNAGGRDSLRVIDGGRAALERELMWSAVYNRPTFNSLMRQLTPCANDGRLQLHSGEPELPHRSGATCAARPTEPHSQ